MSVHNSNWRAKVEIRRLVSERLGRPARCVFETHAGPGTMRNRCWAGAACHSFDVDSDSPKAWHVDSRKVLRDRSFRWHNVDVFDVDPYGNPWEFVWLIARRTAGRAGSIGIAITDGASSGAAAMHQSASTQGYARQWFEASGVSPTVRGKITCDEAEDNARRVLSTWFKSLTWFASTQNAGKTTCRYYGAVVVPHPSDYWGNA